ncbi:MULTISPECIES: putative quinol monooxygenase [Pseudomonas aeruginosa group]|uniref:Antibiotic biosynthesis monooxygenase n=3 Tax=Pseudomonas aeruginosa group TaxID=136841 RepID=A0ABD7JSM8_PSEAI|nr:MULTISPECIES: antibiotic biosynthesis monooxygenase family protein [Pseudomonas aeruginosa group]KFF34679.1 antibiotic biosynthesis monooxygenase [Pseudomonas aeruginosa VRFPA01]VTS66565.1 Antibiotic biosynthesis monooxygenase [Streptococcus dysgalactiae subsp. equisimilis]ABR81856.1 antibiotic biosynthesis monooxygenase domain protein [Pseudomonas aeruginosa PA7]AVK03094.1 antibiotic biosynthesis monooxygenase family protein [Pseudomonas paraeruginosa]AVR68132.1 antibiotic biosynthesis mon
MPALNPASHVVSIRARRGQSQLLGQRLHALALLGRAVPGCLRYEVSQAGEDADLWLIHSAWSDEDALLAHLCGEAQRVFAEVLWQALAATLEIEERIL